MCFFVPNFGGRRPRKARRDSLSREVQFLSIRLGCATPQAENWAIAAAPHRFPGFPCGEFLFSDFGRRGSEKKKVCPVVKKNSRQIPKRLFLFEQSYMTSDNQLFFTSWRSSGDFLLGQYCVARLTQESVSSRIFVRKKGMSRVPLYGLAYQIPSARFGKEKTCPYCCYS